MKILILGATGPRGRHILTKALEKYHEITVLVREPSKLNFQFKMIKGDVLDGKILQNALQGQQAVISSLGKGQSLRSSQLIKNAVSNLIPCIEEAKVKRLIFFQNLESVRPMFRPTFCYL